MLFAVSLSGCSGVNPKFDHPVLITKTADDSKLIIFDSHNKRLVITDRHFKLLKTISHPYFDSIWGLKISNRNEIVVTNTRNTKATFDEEERKATSISEILFFDFEGQLKSQHAWMGEEGPLPFPGQIAFLGTETFCVTDFRLNKVVLFNASGNQIGSFGSFGDEPGRLYYPNDLNVTPEGNLLVVDTFNSRLQLFDAQGGYLKTVAEKGSDEGKLMIPVYTCFDAEGNLYCSELHSMRVSVFDRSYHFKKTIRPENIQVKNDLVGLNGLVHLSNPDELVVADAVNSQIYVFDKQGKLVRTVAAFSVN